MMYKTKIYKGHPLVTGSCLRINLGPSTGQKKIIFPESGRSQVLLLIFDCTLSVLERWLVPRYRQKAKPPYEIMPSLCSVPPFVNWGRCSFNSQIY